MKLFYVGIIRGIVDGRIKVVPIHNGRPTDLDKVRKIRALNTDDAAKQYIEKLTGGTATIKRVH